jgi:hypothetical protein
MGKEIRPDIVTRLVDSQNIEGDETGYVVRNGTFKIAFGPWQEDHEFEILLFDFMHGTLDEKNEAGETLKSVSIRLWALR